MLRSPCSPGPCSPGPRPPGPRPPGLWPPEPGPPGAVDSRWSPVPFGWCPPPGARRRWAGLGNVRGQPGSRGSRGRRRGPGGRCRWRWRRHPCGGGGSRWGGGAIGGGAAGAGGGGVAAGVGGRWPRGRGRRSAGRGHGFRGRGRPFGGVGWWGGLGWGCLCEPWPASGGRGPWGRVGGGRARAARSASPEDRVRTRCVRVRDATCVSTASGHQARRDTPASRGGSGRAPVGEEPTNP